MKLADIAQKLGCRIEGNAELEITGVAGLENAQPGQLTFLSNPKYRAMVETTRASAILLGEGAAIRRPPGAPPLVVLRSENTYLSFAHAIALFYQPPQYSSGIHPTAAVASSARIGTGAHIGPYCFVDEDVHIGENAGLHSFVSLYRGGRICSDFFAPAPAGGREFCALGDRGTLQNGLILGG